MTNLEKYLKENQPTIEEIRIYEKVKRFYQYEDLQYWLEDKIGDDDMSTAKLQAIDEEFHNIVERYDDILSDHSDWYKFMYNAVDYYTGDYE